MIGFTRGVVILTFFFAIFIVNDVCLKVFETISAFAGSNVTMPYAEIGASLSTIAVLVYCCGGVVLLLFDFEFGCTQNIVSR